MKNRFGTKNGKQWKAVLSLLLCFAMLAQPISVFAAEFVQGVQEAAALEQELSELLGAGSYSKGQALVLLRTEDIPEEGILSEGEVLMTAGRAEAEQVLGKAITGDNGPEDEDSLSVLYVTQEGISTRALLKQLLKDSRVIAAEPNYQYGDAPEEEASLLGSGETAELLKASPSEYWDEKKMSKEAMDIDYMNYDLSGFQWSVNRTQGDMRFTLIAQEAKDGISDMNLESWNKYNNGNSLANASGTVVVLDDGVNYDHEDLKNVMAEIPAEDIAALEAYNIFSGTYGYDAVKNAPDGKAVVYYEEGAPKGTHGTHVAGIIASEWNNQGTSGVASGVKVIPIRFLGIEEAAASLAALLRAYTYIYRLAELDLKKDPADRLNIRAVNESFGGGTISPIQSIAEARLGELGIIIVRSAGNDGRAMENYNHDANTVFPIPNGLIVGASDVGGNPDTGYTSYGMYADLFSQGSDILATINPETVFSNANYFPEAYSMEDPNGHQIFFQTFKKAEKKTDPQPGEDEYDYPVFDKDGNLQEYGDVYLRETGYAAVQANYTGEFIFDYDVNDPEKYGGALEISLVKQNPQEGEDSHVNNLILGLKLGQEEVSGGVGYNISTKEGKKYLEIEDIDAEDGGKKVFEKYQVLSGKLKYFGLKWGTGSTEPAAINIYPYLIKRGGDWWKDGDSVCTADSNCPIKIEGINNRDNCATVNYEKYRLFAEKEDVAYCSPISCQAFAYDEQTGEADGYVQYWIYLQLEVSSVKKNLYLDCIGAGDQLLPYAYFDGTSMAAPSATGLVAVQYEACAQEAGFSELSPKEQALYVIERLKSDVTPRKSCIGQCQTGGLLNAKQTGTSKPVISKVSVVSPAEGTLKIEGTNFGVYDEEVDSVTVSARKTDGTWGGETELSVTEWNGSSKSGSVLCTKPAGMKSGYYRVTVTTAAGSCTCPAALNFGDGALFETEIALQETGVDFMNITQNDRISPAMSTSMASAGKKIFLIPSVDNYTDLWVYDPSKGTGEDAFGRVEPSLPEMFGYAKEIHTVALGGMAEADGVLWICGSGVTSGGGTEEEQTSIGLLRVDPVTYASEFFPNPEFLKDVWPSDLVSLGENSPWLVLPQWSAKSGEPGDDNYNPGTKLSLNFYHTQAKWYTGSLELTLPEGIVLTEATDVRFAGYGNDLYAAIGVMNDSISSYHLLKIELTFTEKEETKAKKMEEKEFSASARFRLLMDMPKFGSEEEKDYLAKFALTMFGNQPVMTAAHITAGSDTEYDTFLWDPVNGSYERYGKRFCFEPVQKPQAAVCDGKLYAVGLSTLQEENAKWIMRATKLAKEEYTVTFKNGDTVLQTGKVKAGELPVYSGAAPVKAETAASSYTFSGWSPEIIPANANATYQAVFTEKAKTYLVTFDHQGHGNLPEAQLVAAGSLVKDPGNLSAPYYEFRGWYTDRAGTQKWNFATDKMPAASLRLYALWIYHAPDEEDDDDEEWYDGDDVLPDDDENPWWEDDDGKGSSGGSGSGGSGSGGSGSGGSGSSAGPGVQGNTVSTANVGKTAVTAVVLQKNGTQTFGTSIISIPASMMTEIDKAYLIPGCRWGRSTDGSWFIEENNGRKVFSTWVLVPDSAGSKPVGNYSWYYVDKNGKMLTGWKWIRGLDRKYRCYYFNEEQGSLYGACLMGGSVGGYQLNASGAWIGPDGKEITRTN